MSRPSMKKPSGPSSDFGASRLPREFYTVTATTLAQRLIGQRLVRILDDGTRLAGTIVETEAYLGVRDKAAHTFGGRRTPRNESMYAIGGTAYVYFTYGMHFCMNVVAGAAGDPVAVLLRALEPVEGLDAIRALRTPHHRPRKTPLKDKDLCSGPGRLCEALAIGRDLNGEDLTTSQRLWIEAGTAYSPRQLVKTTRIGISGAEEWVDRPLRWYVRGNVHVSVKASEQ
jgi:DNA-3-methyladenine glycosylase